MLLAAGCFVGALPAAGESRPQKPVHVIVPFAAGGSSDLQARVVCEQLSAILGQQFLVDNRLGAGGAIATELVARAAADGYTLLFGTSAQISILPLVRKVSYDPARDFAPVSVVGNNPFVLAVPASLPVTSALIVSPAGKPVPRACQCAPPSVVTYRPWLLPA